MWVRPLDQKDALEEEMATHSSVLQATVHEVTKTQTD